MNYCLNNNKEVKFLPTKVEVICDAYFNKKMKKEARTFEVLYQTENNVA